MPHWKPNQRVEIRELAPGLHRISATAGRHGGRQIHSYFLEHPGGNVLFHGPDRVPFYKQHAGFFDERGGIGIQALTHHGDASKACAHVAKTWGAPLRVNRWDLDAARRASGLEIASGLENDAPLAPGVDGIHLPGHSVGFTAFRVAIEGRSYLVLGHAIRQLPAGSWGAGVNRLLVESGLRSLRKLRDLDVDFALPDRTRDRPPPLLFGKDERGRILDQVEAYLAKKHGLSGA